MSCAKQRIRDKSLFPLTSLKLEGTKISRSGNNKLGLNIFKTTISIIESQISCDVAVPVVTPNASLTHPVLRQCVLTNVSFNMKPSDIVYTQQDISVLARPLSGNGVPTVVPQKLGQEYYDTTNKKLYKAFGTIATSDWIVMN